MEILTPLCCYYHQDFHSNAVHATSRPHFYPRRTPPYRIRLLDFACPKVSAAGLSPVHFRGPRPRRVSFYALFKGWLLLSLPSRCLGTQTPFGLTLSRHLGALTLVWVVPLSEQELTPRNLSPTVYGANGFGV